MRTATDCAEVKAAWDAAGPDAFVTLDDGGVVFAATRYPEWYQGLP